MAQMSSGSVLKETRERKGYDLATVARRLRIRPDILRAIEASDFSSMPPKGYARNMVNAYARLLGLNPTEIVNMYLDEVYAYQVEKARGRSAESGFIMDPDNRRTRLRNTRTTASKTGQMESRAPQNANDDLNVTSRMSRHLYDDRTQFSRDDYGATGNQSANSKSGDRDFMSHHSGYSSGSRNFIDDGKRSRLRGNRDIHVGQTPMEYSASRLPSVFQSRLAIGIAIAAIAILVFVLVFFVFFRQDQSNADDVSQLPVSGITDTTGDNESSSAASVEVTPTSARVSFKAKDGAQCYVETYVDGKIDNNYTLNANEEKTVNVTGKWTITTWDKDSLAVTVQDEEVTLEPSDEYGGMYAYTLDFQAWLNNWLSAHGTNASKRQAAVENATNAANEAKSANAGNSAAAQQTGDITSQETDESKYSDDDQYYYDVYGQTYDESGYYDGYTDDSYDDSAYNNEGNQYQ